MNYGQLFKNLKRNPPKGWRVIHYVSGVSGGVYFWPAHVPHQTELPSVQADGRLLHFSMLFEFHVIKKSSRARILARTRFHGAKPKNDFRWLSLQHLATQHCGGKDVNKAPANSTASVALWDDGDLQQIAFATPIKRAANHIRDYLQHPAYSLSSFINHL